MRPAIVGTQLNHFILMKEKQYLILITMIIIIIIIIINILQVDLSDGEDGGEENAMGKKGKRDAKLLEKSGLSVIYWRI